MIVPPYLKLLGFSYSIVKSSELCIFKKDVEVLEKNERGTTKMIKGLEYKSPN